MAIKIHPTAVIEQGARLADGVEVGPYCYVGAEVEIGEGTRLISHVRITGRTRLGRENVIHPFTVIGSEPQDTHDPGEGTRTEIGDRNVLRESVTINRGTRKDSGVTRLGSDNYLMACSHVGHDCIVGNHVVLVNGALLGGHSEVQDFAYLSGHSAVHQYTTVGRYAFIGGCSRITRDAPPYMLTQGTDDPEVVTVNTVGLRRHGFHPDVIQALKEAHRSIWASGLPLPDAIDFLEATFNGTYPEVKELIRFLQNTTRGRNGRAREALRDRPRAASR